MNGVLSGSYAGIALLQSLVPFNKFSVTSACKLSLTVSGLPNQRIGVYKDTVDFTTGLRRLLTTSGFLGQTISNQMVINLPGPGTYYIAVRP